MNRREAEIGNTFILKLQPKKKMASVSTQPQRTPTFASNSSYSAAPYPSLPTATAHPRSQVKGAAYNGLFHGDEKKHYCADGLDDLESTHCIERFKKYDEDYTHGLSAKYFSGKTLFGVDIFDEKMIIDEEIIKSTRLPSFLSYADPGIGFTDQCSKGSTPAADTEANVTNGKHTW